jgi:hypothetical protein
MDAPVQMPWTLADDRDFIAKRLERLARQIRANPTATADELDLVYAEIAKLAGTIRPILAGK